VKNCTEINELLSAYSDNELNGSDKLSVEEHLAACENCSALLEIYKEISISADESSVPVPDALRIGVMNRIRSESLSGENISPEIETKKKKWWQHQVLLTRLAPIAACLAVVLLVWQFGGNMFSMNDSAAPEAAGEPAAMSPAADSIPAPAAAMPAPEVNLPFSLDDSISEEADGSYSLEAAGGLRSFTDLVNEATRRSVSPGSAADDADSEELETADISIRFSDFIGQAYAEITIKGELPEFLTNYEPFVLDLLSEWELIFEIPSTEVDTLMAELINRPGVSLVYNHNNSTYAIVLFSSS